MHHSSDPTLDADARALRTVLTQLARNLSQGEMDCVCCYDLTRTQANALSALLSDEELGIGDLAERLGLDKSTTSRAISDLVDRDLVHREPIPGNRRAVRLRPTPEGRRLHQQVEADLLEHDRALLAGFPPEARTSVISLLTRLAAHCCSARPRLG